MKNFESWLSEEHPVLFDSRAYFPFFSLSRVYNNFNEFKLFNRFVPKREKLTLLEVGCAAGELYRYFKYNYPRINYTGCDICKAGIERAKIKYPNGTFLATDTNLSQVKNVSPDYLFARDVVMHQVDPFGFLKLLCFMPKRGTILRLRTKDVGPSELDVEKSCQYYLGSWVPYIVLNCDEIVSYLKSLHKCSRIVLLKSYVTLGGFNYRYLPKDCYLESTGTAETAIYIELSEEAKDADVEIMTGQEKYRISITDRILYRAIKHILRPKFKSRVRW